MKIAVAGTMRKYKPKLGPQRRPSCLDQTGFVFVGFCYAYNIFIYFRKLETRVEKT